MIGVYELGRLGPVGQVEFQSSDDMQEEAIQELIQKGWSPDQARRAMTFTSAGSPYTSSGSVMPFNVWPEHTPRFCSYCDSEVLASATKCPQCGAPTRTPWLSQFRHG